MSAGSATQLLYDKLTKFLNEVLNTLVGDSVVSPLPAEDFLNEAAGLKTLDNHHDLEVGYVSQVLVLGQVGVLLHYEHTLHQQILKDLPLVFLGY